LRQWPDHTHTQKSNQRQQKLLRPAFWFIPNERAKAQAKQYPFTRLAHHDCPEKRLSVALAPLSPPATKHGFSRALLGLRPAVPPAHTM